MKLRRYTVIVWTNNRTKEITKYGVDDHDTDKEPADDSRPCVAEFPVSDVYPADQQRQRAIMFSQYMNKIAEATERAYEETMLMDVLKQPAQGQTTP